MPVNDCWRTRVTIADEAEQRSRAARFLLVGERFDRADPEVVAHIARAGAATVGAVLHDAPQRSLRVAVLHDAPERSLRVAVLHDAPERSLRVAVLADGDDESAEVQSRHREEYDQPETVLVRLG
jgi:hypothetical protein